MPNPFDQQAPIPGVKHIILIASGKGGVGKSTVSSHLAVAMASLGHKVGLLDADIYGPSQPRMFGALNQRPSINENKKIEPLTRYGVKLMSMGFMVEEGAAVIWRGPMLFKAIDQFFKDVHWGELDYLFIDLPPGTGDVQLTIVQKVPVSGAVAVTTPQNIAFIDVRKAIDMFQRLNIPVLGVVENMSALKIDGQPDMPLFPKGELEAYMKSNNLEKLAQVPFYQPLTKACEIGIPLLETQPQNEISQLFVKVAQQIHSRFQ